MEIPTNGMIINQDTIFQPGVYNLPDGITIAADGITVDGNGALLVGNNHTGRGISVLNQAGVTLKNLRVQEYYHGIYCQDCQDLTITGCQVAATAEILYNTIFLDIWLPLEKAYGGGICLAGVKDSRVLNNDLQHQMVGLLSYNCRNLTVKSNVANYCSGWGFHLYDTCDSLYEENCADFCCRWEPRGERKGHMGADAAGFLILYRSSNNIFRRNQARLGGDGFFLAGLSPAMEPVPCNGNLFEENDGSYSPNIAFEATFSANNIYRRNYANHCNYGFWLGFSRDGVLEENQMVGNVRAGIATENGINFQVNHNLFKDNDHGVLLWSHPVPEFLEVFPENNTSHHWKIDENSFIHNNKAVRISEDQDHGVRGIKPTSGQEKLLRYQPHHHAICQNKFEDNRLGIEAISTLDTLVEANQFDILDVNVYDIEK
jgi:parallel beta-helix repeat protein